MAAKVGATVEGRPPVSKLFLASFSVRGLARKGPNAPTSTLEKMVLLLLEPKPLKETRRPRPRRLQKPLVIGFREIGSAGVVELIILRNARLVSSVRVDVKGVLARREKGKPAKTMFKTIWGGGEVENNILPETPVTDGGLRQEAIGAL